MKNKKEIVYISAPIRGYNLNERRNYFSSMSNLLREYGYIPVNPMLNGVSDDAPIKDHMRADFRMLLECDRILLCGGWESSNGCQQEATLALWSGICVLPLSAIGL